MFSRLGRWSFKNRGKVALIWLTAALAMAIAGAAVGTSFSTELSLPDVESRQGFEIIDEHFDALDVAAEGGTLVFRAEQGVEDPEVVAEMSAFFDSVDQIEGVSVTSPYTPQGAQQISRTGPEAGKIAYAVVGLPRDISLEAAAEISHQITELMPEIPGVQIEIGGQTLAEFEVPESEALGLAFAIVVLIFAFGSVLAMGLPIGVAIAGIGAGTLIIRLVSNVVAMPDFASTVAIMLGLGVGIDYALFIVTRFRENVRGGQTFEDATASAIDTAGRAVCFAAATVVVSLLGMLLVNLSFISGLAISAAIVVAVTAVAGITLLPALLGFVGGRVEITRWRGLIAAGLAATALAGFALGVDWLMTSAAVAAGVVLIAGLAYRPLQKEVKRKPEKPLRETLPYRWSRFIQGHPWQMSALGAAILIVLALPVLSLRLGFSDEGNFPEDTTTRRAYDLLAAGFGPGFNGPLLLATELENPSDAQALEGVTAAITADPGVAYTTPAFPNDLEAPTAAIWRVYPTTPPQDEATTELVHRLRDEVLPEATAGTGLDVVVSGSVAAAVDFSEYLSGRLPLFIGLVLAFSFLLLMAAFRSILVPIKAVIMNLLAIGAAYGVVTAIFQWGWLGNLINIAPAPIEPFVPMMMFAIVFGLSMDYEVFLLSRIREEYLRTGDSRASVADGLAATARVITAAAAIMVVVFGSFVLDPNRIIKLFGVGLAFAVLVDATVVRMVLVPATMELLGDKNWWLPKWLDRILPQLDVEGHGPVADTPAPASS